MRLKLRGGLACVLLLVPTFALADSQLIAGNMQNFTLKRADLSQRVTRGDLQLPVVMLGSDVEVYEVPVSGAPVLKESDTHAANEAIDEAVTNYFTDLGQPRLTRIGALSDAESAEVKEYFSLYQAVAQAAAFTMLNGWEARRENFQYSLGSGLPWLQERTGSRYALVVQGKDFVSSDGRKALGAAMVLAGALTGRIVILGSGETYASAGLIDLSTGDLVWVSRNAHAYSSLADTDAARAMFAPQLDQVFKQ